ncbi:MAG: NTP transferase domain-containing protein [Blastochloris sp.]|nr:NTP transferase domain-containing protein [Blastochloris sp.]
MKAIILAAGKGKRMGELTRELPKPMVQVHGRPILEHILCGLRDHAGVRDFFFHHRSLRGGHRRPFPRRPLPSSPHLLRSPTRHGRHR